MVESEFTVKIHTFIPENSKSHFARANSVPKKYSQIYAITLLFTFMVNIEVKCMFLLGFIKIANRKSD